MTSIAFASQKLRSTVTADRPSANDSKSACALAAFVLRSFVESVDDPFEYPTSPSSVPIRVPPANRTTSLTVPFAERRSEAITSPSAVETEPTAAGSVLPESTASVLLVTKPPATAPGATAATIRQATRTSVAAVAVEKGDEGITTNHVGATPITLHVMCDASHITRDAYVSALSASPSATI